MSSFESLRLGKIALQMFKNWYDVGEPSHEVLPVTA